MHNIIVDVMANRNFRLKIEYRYIYEKREFG